jgi:ligand-binding sensor domain-containing protein/two-component sensor histidine kinase
MPLPGYKCPVIKLLLQVVVSAVLALPSSGQSYVITNYKANTGIAHDFVRDIAVDSSGFIWLATWDGLTRYDGTDFVSYYHNPSDSTSIPYFSVNTVNIDSEDNLWITVDNGELALFDRATEKFKVIRTLGGHSLSTLDCLDTGPDGSLYFILVNEIIKYDPGSGSIKSFQFESSVTDMAYFKFGSNDIIFETPDHFWITGNEFYEISLRKVEGDTIGHADIINTYGLSRNTPGPSQLLPFPGTARLVHDRSGRTMLASSNGLYTLETESGLFKEYSGNTGDLSFADTLPVIFYENGCGLNIWMPGIDTVIKLPENVIGQPIKIFMHDPFLFWISHQDPGGTPSGISKVIMTPYQFTHINPLPEENNRLNVFGIATDVAGGLWLAARGRNYLVRVVPDGRVEKINQLSDAEMAVLWHPRALIPDTNGIWIGYYHKLLVYYDLTTGLTEKHEPCGMAHTVVRDSSGSFLIADQGIIRYDPVTRVSESLWQIDDTLNIFKLHLQGNTLWAGGNFAHILRYDLKTGDHEIIRISDAILNIEDICPSDNGDLWLTTLGAGVCRYNTETGEKEYYTTSSGLSNNTTYSLLKDKTGNIWVSTNDGISVINPASGSIRIFGENDGVQVHEFNSDAAWVTDNGKFIFGGVGGAIEFDPEQLLGNKVIADRNKIIIKELEVSARRKVLDKPLYKADTVILDKGENNFHISFVIPDYRDPEKIRYRYRIDAEPDIWHYTNHSDRNINFSNMQPGWCTLEIQSTDIDGIWGNSRKLTLFLKPHFYQTLFFRLTIPLIILMLLALISYLVINYLRQREQQKRDLLRQQALRGQMNPHFIFNALNSINYFISNNDRLSANRYISDFSRLIRNVLNNMNEDYVRLSVELDSLEEYLRIEHLRFGDKFDYLLEVDPSITPESVMVSPGFVQPFVENAIWHGVMGLDGRKGRITISLKMKDNSIMCTVDDDGVGRVRSEAMKDRSLPRKSKGISLAMERLRIINSLRSANYRISISDLHPDLENTGTRVEIEMPVMT